MIKQYKEYQGSVFKDKYTNRYCGRVLNIKYNIRFVGETVEEAQKNFEKAVDEYISSTSK